MIVGIDLGTTNSLVAAYGAPARAGRGGRRGGVGGNRSRPSVNLRAWLDARMAT